MFDDLQQITYWLKLYYLSSLIGKDYTVHVAEMTIILE